jgi:hypothetical protein
MDARRFILAFAALCMCIIFSRISVWKDHLFTYDKAGYHIFLPATIIYHDLNHLSFYPAIEQQYHPSGNDKWYAIHAMPNGNKLNKYALGTAVLETPFFLAAHLYCNITGSYPADGYNLPYQLAAFLSNLAWCIIGLVILRTVLRRYFGDWTTFVTLVCITLGTNLFYQTTYDIGSHVYSFALIAAVLYFTDNWYRRYSIEDACMLGLALGFVIITRPVNILVAIIPLLWNIHNIAGLKHRLQLFKAKYVQLLTAFVLFLGIALIQMAYWKYITGSWIYFSYKGEGFNFAKPHVWQGLLSYRKGWLVYTPIAMFIIPGIYFLYKKHKQLVLPIVVFMAVIIYTVFSWTNWWYGSGFSSRVMIDFYAILALPFAALFSHVNASRHRFARQLIVAVYILLISLNIFQTWQFNKGIIHGDRMTGGYYRRIFGKTQYTSEDLQYLMNDKEYWDAMREAYD